MSVNGLPPPRIAGKVIQVLLPKHLTPRSSPSAEEDYLSLVFFWLLLGKAKKPFSHDSSSSGAQEASAYANIAHQLLSNTGLGDQLFTLASELLLLFKQQPKHNEVDSTHHGSSDARAPGALLMERASSAAVSSSTPFSAAPFFAEGYAKSHAKDLFQNFPKMLAEVVMRLMLAIHSCASKQDQATLNSKRNFCLLLSV